MESDAKMSNSSVRPWWLREKKTRDDNVGPQMVTMSQKNAVSSHPTLDKVLDVAHGLGSERH